MAFEFVLEDGTGLSTSTSYVSLAEFRQYWENRGVSYATPTYPDATIQAWLNEATSWADMTYHWAGTISDDDQALLVPRIGWVDVYGRDLDDSVPTYLKNGICELAAQRQGTDPESVASVGVSSKRYGPVSVSYMAGANGQTVRYPTAEKWFNMMQMDNSLRNWPA